MTLTGGASCSLLNSSWGRRATAINDSSSNEPVKKKPIAEDKDVAALRKKVAALELEIAELKKADRTSATHVPKAVKDRKVTPKLLKGKEKEKAETVKKIEAAAKTKKTESEIIYYDNSWDGHGYNF